jgi:hypothetical protein
MSDRLDVFASRTKTPYTIKKIYNDPWIAKAASCKSAPGSVPLRYGTAKWGWRHIRDRHGWNKRMDTRIAETLFCADAIKHEGGGSYRYTRKYCNPFDDHPEVFRVIQQRNTTRKDGMQIGIITAYPAAGGCPPII